MELALFLKSMLVGFFMSAPVGPIAVLCIRRTLVFGRLSGLVAGVGAATADSLYAMLAGMGMTLVANVLMEYHTVLRALGGVALLGMGITTWRSAVSCMRLPGASSGFWSTYVSTLLLTLANPLTLFLFAAVFASVGMDRFTPNYQTAVLLVGGVFLGAVLWWFLLSGLINCLRGKFTRHVLEVINRISGVVLALFGVAALVSIIVQ
ncbi:MAG: LysE family translocator [Negativicutes bacterium]|nr:LysE family translocator [Negativicutes bacterium]